MDVTLRPMTRADFPMFARWLREQVVAEWWHDDATALDRRYGPSIDGDDPTALRIALVDSEPAGLIQWYRFADEPEYAAELRPWVHVPTDAWSLDYLLAGARFRGRGIASAMLRAALAEIGDAVVIVPVHERNGASSALLLRNGFGRVAAARLDPDNPAHTQDHVVLRRPSPSASVQVC